MKVIGKKSSSVYICEVDHTELEKYLNLYFDKLKKLDVGQDIDLAKAYDYSGEICSALESTREFISSNKKIVEAILNGLSIESIRQEKN